MAFTAASLADGQLATSKAAIYTVAASTKAYARCMYFFNTNAAVQTINVYLKRSGGTSRQIRRFELAQYESASLVEGDQAIVLSAGDAIEAFTTTATAVDYFISGVTEA